jgi:Flp pilus assembly protein TadG
MRHQVRHHHHPRRGAVVIIVAVLMIAFMAMVSFAVDMGYISTVHTQLQRSADAAALAAAAEMNKVGQDGARVLAQNIGKMNASSGGAVNIASSDVVYGIWDLHTRTFTPTPPEAGGNAVRVRITQQPNLFFARAIRLSSSTVQVESIAIATPRDIAFVVDLSGSMNDDTETAWATEAINNRYASSGYGTVGNQLMEDIFADLSLGSFPGTNQYIGHNLGAWYQSYQDWAYPEMSKDNGPLSGPAVPSNYQILPTDDETVRKAKTYSYIIDQQIAVIMPNARPSPSSSSNYAFWAKYLDYVIQDQWVYVPEPPPPPSDPDPTPDPGPGPEPDPGPSGGNPPPPPPPPPSPPPIGWWQPTLTPPALGLDSLGTRPEIASTHHRSIPSGNARSALAHLLPGAILAGWGQPPDNRWQIPTGIDWETRLLWKFNNPNRTIHPSASDPWGYRNLVGPLTYVNFLLDHGRDLPIAGQDCPISVNSSHCPWHTEATDGGNFDFPPREQPAHACRRSIIAALTVIRNRNLFNPSPDQRDWVTLITFDKSNPGPQVAQNLTSDYGNAMMACTRLQAVGDRDASTATESGLQKAQDIIKPLSQGGQGREFSDKVVVLLTDGVPNVTASATSEIADFMSDNPDSNFFGGGYWWLDGPLMQSKIMTSKRWKTYPVGIGLGTDYNFMDRMARMGTTANSNGQSPRGSGNPAEYETRLKQIFQEIIDNAGVRLVN